MNDSSSRFDRFVLIAILAGIVLGVFSGWLVGPPMASLKFLGDLFMNALKAVIVPLIAASMIVGITGLGDVRRLGRIGGVTITYYALTTAIAVMIGLAVTNALKPGLGAPIAGAAAPDLIHNREFSFIDLLVEMIPSSVFGCMADNQVLPLIVCSLIFGGVLTTLGEEGEPLIRFFAGLNAAMMKIVQLIMIYAPIGIFALISSTLGEKGGGSAALEEIAKIGKFVVTVVLGLSLHGFLVLPLILFLFAKRNPLVYSFNMLGALTTAFSTDSSAATLPMTMKCAERNNRISPQTSSFVLPLGATVNMDGTALYEAAAALFIAEAYGISLSSLQQIVVFLTATLASVGAAAIPHAGLVTMVMVLQAVGLPLEGIGLVFTVDWFLDRCRTVINVWGDAVGAAVVDRFVPPKHETPPN
ncbi:MAG: dicarboxylate/amino acid:cation symporter [Candidatus Omnitrophota bacterium]